MGNILLLVSNTSNVTVNKRQEHLYICVLFTTYPSLREIAQYTVY